MLLRAWDQPDPWLSQQLVDLERKFPRRITVTITRFGTLSYTQYKDVALVAQMALLAHTSTIAMFATSAK